MHVRTCVYACVRVSARVPPRVLQSLRVITITHPSLMSRLIYTSQLDGLMPQDAGFLLSPSPPSPSQASVVGGSGLVRRASRGTQLQTADCPRPRPEALLGSR